MAATLEELIAQAEREGKLLQSTYDPGIIFTPEKMRFENAQGHFRWGAVNFVLVAERDVFAEARGELMTHMQEFLDSALLSRRLDSYGIVLKAMEELKAL